MVRPVPIPNTAVKHSLANGSGCIASARVGCRQFFKSIRPENSFSGLFAFRAPARGSGPSCSRRGFTVLHPGKCFSFRVTTVNPWLLAMPPIRQIFQNRHGGTPSFCSGLHEPSTGFCPRCKSSSYGKFPTLARAVKPAFNNTAFRLHFKAGPRTPAGTTLHTAARWPPPRTGPGRVVGPPGPVAPAGRDGPANPAAPQCPRRS